MPEEYLGQDTLEPFIERKFKIDGKPLICRWYKPYLVPNFHDPDDEHPFDYHCRWAIQWPDREKLSESVGFDAVQALVLSMKTVSAFLHASEAYREGGLTYFGSTELDLLPFDD